MSIETLPASKGQSWLEKWLPVIVLAVVGGSLPLWGDEFFGTVGTRICVYWVICAGLNLVVGYAGQIAIGWVALLTVGAYTASALVAGRITPEIHPYLALIIAAIFGAISGLIVGLPALRLRTFYFAMTTLGFSTIITQIALAWRSATGGGVGIPGPLLPEPFDTPWGLYFFCLVIALICTWMTCNISASRYGRALIAVRDAEVAAEAVGIHKPTLLTNVFLLSGAFAGLAGGLFASLQSYITPEAFSFDLSVLFFIAILIGGRGSILGPLIGTAVLTVLPDFAAPLVQWSTFLYAVLLLAIVLLIPGGIAELLDFTNRKPIDQHREIRPRPELLPEIMGTEKPVSLLSLKGIVLAFGGVRAVDGVDLDIRGGEIHGLIGPNGSGKTTTLNAISGFYVPQEGTVNVDGADITGLGPHRRADFHIARTFQTPRIIGEESVIENVMVGGTTAGRGNFAEALLALPRHRRDEARLHSDAMTALRLVGLEQLAHVRADRLQHSELRFVEIARAVMMRPRFLLLDEPAAGLSVDEIRRLAGLISAISAQGTGVLLVEHHADLIFEICDRVTVLNLGKVLASGDPEEVRTHREVVNAYLGA
ncbi:MAG: ATP-binding cassette domain-containing protein [Hyphomicrobiaceae bacterium]